MLEVQKDIESILLSSVCSDFDQLSISGLLKSIEYDGLSC